MTRLMSTPKRLTLFAILSTCAFCLLGFLYIPPQASALEEPEYKPGENYYIDSLEAFLGQDIQYKGAESISTPSPEGEFGPNELQGSTTYWMTCPFYLEWTSPDMVIYEGESAYIGCGAVGLNDLHYEWFLSRDGGTTFERPDLVGNEHTIEGLTCNDPLTTPYLYVCVITNGDNTSRLTTDVSITVLPREGGSSSSFGKTGDQEILLIIVMLFCAAAIASVIMAISEEKRHDDELERVRRQLKEAKGLNHSEWDEWS